MKLVPVVSSFPLSPLRIGAWSTALSLHLLAFALLAMPPRALESRPVAPRADVILADFVARVVSRPEPVPPVPRPPGRVPIPERTIAPPVTPVVPVILSEPSPVALPVAAAPDLAPATDSAAEPGDGAGAVLQLAYRDAPPPPYPALAQRRGWEGTVLLRVRVDETGRAREVQVERSSGHAVLDRSASEQVLRRWRFEPARVGGRTVAAWARVPIGFRLDRG